MRLKWFVQRLKKSSLAKLKLTHEYLPPDGMLISLVFPNSDNMQNFSVYLLAGFIHLESDVLYGNLCTEITFSLKPFFPKPTFSIQCNVILITLLPFYYY